MPTPRLQRALSAIRAISLGAFAVYAWSAAPGVEWLDSGELCAAGWSLGISHPPGQPGYSMLAHAASWLPIGEVAFRINVLSAACAALAIAGVFALARALVGRDDAAALVGASCGALFAGLSPIVFEQATRAEVYAPVAALVVWGAVLTVRFVRAAPEERVARDALAASLLFALAVSIHPLVAATVALPCAAAIVVAARRRALRLAPAAIGLAVLGLAVLAYLPLRAAAPGRALIVWGEPDSWDRFVSVVTGSAYGQNFAAAGFGPRFVGHLMLVAEGTGMAALGAGIAGLCFGALTRLRGSATLLGVVLLVTAGAATQRIFFAANPDVHGYLVPAVLCAAAGIAVLLTAVARIVASTRAPRISWVLALVPVVALAFAGPRVHVQDGGARRSDDALRHHDATVGEVAAGPAIYFADSDHAIFPAQYERVVAGARPDVALANRSLVQSSWFLRMLDRSLPEIFVPFVDDGGRADALVARMIDENLAAGRPVGGESARVERVRAVPLGIGYRYVAPGTADPPPPPPLSLDYEGDVGRRVARNAELGRADHLLGRRGRPLWRDLPSATPVFIFEDWQADLLARDARFLEGHGAGTPPDEGAPFELRLLHAWHRLKGAEDEAPLAALGLEARLATARMLAAHDDARGAERQARAVLGALPDHEGAVLFLASLLANEQKLDEAEELLGRLPRSAAAIARLGLVHAKQGRMPEAIAAWRLSLTFDPDQPEVRAWLQAAGSPP